MGDLFSLFYMPINDINDNKNTVSTQLSKFKVENVHSQSAAKLQQNSKRVQTDTVLAEDQLVEFSYKSKLNLVRLLCQAMTLADQIIANGSDQLRYAIGGNYADIWRGKLVLAFCYSFAKMYFTGLPLDEVSMNGSLMFIGHKVGLDMLWRKRTSDSVNSTKVMVNRYFSIDLTTIKEDIAEFVAVFPSLEKAIELRYDGSYLVFDGEQERILYNLKARNYAMIVDMNEKSSLQYSSVRGSIVGNACFNRDFTKWYYIFDPMRDIDQKSYMLCRAIFMYLDDVDNFDIDSLKLYNEFDVPEDLDILIRREVEAVTCVKCNKVVRFEDYSDIVWSEKGRTQRNLNPKQ
jgi:hypothetical protein